MIMDFSPGGNDFEIDILDLTDAELAQFQIVDVREPGEDKLGLLGSLIRRPIQSMPMSKFSLLQERLDKAKKYLFVCQRGANSSQLVSDLRASGFSQAFCLKDGVEAVRRKYIA
jgi:rhodanese-related sulfurtransferase